MTQAILNPWPEARPLVVADCEHYDSQLPDWVGLQTPFDLLVPMRQRASRRAATLPPEALSWRWLGFATAKLPFQVRRAASRGFQLIQRHGQRPQDYTYKCFYATAERPELPDLTDHYPNRWHIEEFFRFDQDLGWERAGTLNLNIRYGQMTMALIAQALLHQLRRRLGPPLDQWDAPHFAQDLFGGLDGDVRVEHDTIVVAYYNAPQPDALRPQYEQLPAKPAAEGVCPHIPWLYNFKLDFRFK